MFPDQITKKLQVKFDTEFDNILRDVEQKFAEKQARKGPRVCLR
jgi:hypothetical protein